MLLRVVPETAYRPPTRFQNSLTPCVHQAVSSTFFQVFAALAPHAFFLTAYRTGATVRCALTAFSNLASACYRTLCARTHARPAGLTDAMCAYAIGHNRPAPLTPHGPTPLDTCSAQRPLGLGCFAFLMSLYRTNDKTWSNNCRAFCECAHDRKKKQNSI